MAKKLTFELGFDWNMPAGDSALGVVYALQMELVDDGTGSVVSPCNSSQINVGDTLAFQIFDFTGSPPAPGGAVPQALQILFAGATNDRGDFSPVLDDGLLLPQVATTTFEFVANADSVAYGEVSRAWDVTTLPSPLILGNPGRFELRAMLTVAVSGQMARFYRIDPEMIVGEGGSGGG